MKTRAGSAPLFRGRWGRGLRVPVLTLVLGAFPLSFLVSSAWAVNGGVPRDVFCSRGFSLNAYPTFSFEPLEGTSDYNGLGEADWARVRAALVNEMTVRGYRHVEKGGQLQLSYGAFPPIDLSHPVTGLFVKFRLGTAMLDLTKWSGGAMADAPYTPETLVGLVGVVARDIPSRATSLGDEK